MRAVSECVYVSVDAKVVWMSELNERWVRGDVESCGGDQRQGREKRKSGGVRHKKKTKAKKCPLYSMSLSLYIVRSHIHRKRVLVFCSPALSHCSAIAHFFYIHPVLLCNTKSRPTVHTYTKAHNKYKSGAGNNRISFGAIFFFF